MNSEADPLSRAKAHVALCSDPVWAPNDETNAYRRANQELWVRSCRIQKRYESGSSAPEPLHMTMQEIISPVPWEDSNSTMLQTIEEEPLVSFSCILSKNNRQWLGTSNWLIEIKKQFPKLEVDLDETKKKIRVKNCSTFYEDGVSDKDIENFSVKRYVVESAEEEELEKLIYNKGLSDIWNKKSDPMDSLFILPADLQLSLYNLGTQFTFQNSPSSISPAESSLASSTQDFIQNDTSQIGPIKPRRRRTPRIVYDKNRHQQNLSLNVDVPEFHPKRSGSHSSSQSSTNTSLNIASNSRLPNKLTFSDVISVQTPKGAKKTRVKITSSLSDLTEAAQFPLFKNDAKTFPILPSITEPKFQSSDLFSSSTYEKLINIDADECSELFEPQDFMTPINTTVSVSTDSAMHSVWVNSALSCQKDMRFAEALLKPSLDPNATTPIYSVAPHSLHLTQIPISSIYLQESTRTDNKPMFISHSSRANESPVNFRPIPVFQRPPEFYLLQSNRDSLVNNIIRTRKPTGTGVDYSNLVFLTSSPCAGHSRSLENVRIPHPEISRLRNAQYNQDFLASGAKSGQGKRLSADKTQKEIEVLYPPGVDASSPIAKWLQTGYPTRAKDFGHVGELLSGITAINVSSDGSDTSSVRGPHTLTEISQGRSTTSTDLFPNLTQKITESKTNSKPVPIPQQPNTGSKKKFKTTFSAVVQTVNTQTLAVNHNSIEPKKRLYSAVLSNSTTAAESFPSIPMSTTPPIENISNSDLKVDLKVESEIVVTPPAPIMNKTAINTEFPKLTSNCKPVTKECSSKKTVSAGSIEKCYDELERQAIEQYKDSDESLNSKYFQELERQALEQYSASSQSICNTESRLVMNAEAYYETNDILNGFDDEPGTSIGDNTDSDNVNASKNEPANLNYIRLNKTTQKKGKNKKKTKKSNLKNCFSPRTGAEYPDQSDPKDIKELHVEEQKVDVFLLYYTHKNLNFVLKLVTDETKLSSHLKSFFIDFKAGAIPGRFRIFELLATAENGNENGNDLQFIPMEDYNFVDINCVTETIDHNIVKSSVAYFEDIKIDVFLELICMTNNRKINKNIRLLVPCQSKIDNLKKIPRKKVTKKEVVTRKEQTKKPKNISKNQNLCKESKFFLRYLQLGMKPICDRPMFCQFLFQSFEHIEYNKPNILNFIRFEEIHNLIEYIQTVWKRLKGRYTSGVFHDYIPNNMVVKFWSPNKYYTGHRRFSKSDYDLLKRRTFDNLYRISINGKEYFQPPPKQPALRKYFSFIDHNELKCIIEYEKSFFDHRQGYGITYTEMLKMLKIQPNGEEHEETERKSVCFHKRVSKVLRHINVDFEYLVKINTGCIVDYYRFFEYRDDDLRPNVSFIYHLTADILQISFLYNWGFLAVDQVICDPWLDNTKKFKAISPHIIPIITPNFVTKVPAPKIILPKPRKPDKQIINLSIRNEKNIILKLSEQQKSDLKSTIALTLNREIKMCGQKDLKDDVQKIARTLSELIKDDIIEKLEQTVINKRLQNEKDIEGIIYQSAEDIHRRIINSTFAEIVLETCRIKKQKDKDADRKEQILSAMSDYISQSYANLSQRHNSKDRIISPTRCDDCRTALSNQNKMHRKKPVDIAVPEIVEDLVKNTREQSTGVMTDPISNAKCVCELTMEQFKTASDSVQNLCRDNNQNCKGDYETNGNIAMEISKEDSCCQTGDDGRDFECKLDSPKTELSPLKLTPRKKKCESQRKKNINKIDARNDTSASSTVPRQRCSSGCNSGCKQHAPTHCLNPDRGENIIIAPECNGKADESGDLPSYMKTSAKCEKGDEVDLANKITKYSPRPNRKYQRKPDSNTGNQVSKVSRRPKLLMNEEKDEPPLIDYTEDFSEKKTDSSCLLM